jgi:hypothetical protein
MKLEFYVPSFLVFVQVLSSSSSSSSFIFFSEFFFKSIYSNIKMNFGVSIFSLYNISVLTFRRKINMKYELII